jgi:hypothetical protein
MSSAREEAAAALLVDGRVLVLGGFVAPSSPLDSADVFDPAAGVFAPAVPMAVASGDLGATLLANGRILKTGGIGSSGSSLANAELFRPGLPFFDSRRPIVSSITSPVLQPAVIAIAGSGFRGDSAGSSSSTNDSSTGFPLLRLQRVEGDRIVDVPSNPGIPWSDTAFDSKRLYGLPLGHWRATIFADGIPSIERVISVGKTGLRFSTIAPCRLVDTRQPAGEYGGPAIAGGSRRMFRVIGQCGIPEDAYAVAVNLTAVAPTGAGDLRVFPSDAYGTPTSVLNFGALRTRAANAVLALGSSGALTVQCDLPAGTTNLLIDVNGYFQ